MQVTLKRFGQEVDLSDPKVVVHTLVLEVDGREESIPVPEETIKALVAKVYSRQTGAAESSRRRDNSPPPAARPAYQPPEDPEDPRHTEEDLADASEFGGVVEETPEPAQTPTEAVEKGGCPNCGNPKYDPKQTCPKCGFWDGPDSEDEVESL
jgi:rubrerythrin